jgi:hypothetical protein
MARSSRPSRGLAAETKIGTNPGGGRFYFTSNDKSAPPVDSLGVIDAQTGAWLQNCPIREAGKRSPSDNNHIFTPVQVTAAII